MLIIVHVSQVNEKLFPCELSNKNAKLAEEAVKLAVETWGKRSLTELEAEDRLSYSCEKVKFSNYTLSVQVLAIKLHILSIQHWIG